MRTILDVLRLRLETGLSERKSARSLGVPRTTVQEYLARFGVSGLAWPLAPDMDEATLARALFAQQVPLPVTSRPLPDWATIAGEKKRKGVTPYLLWQEYRSREPAGYGYSRFAEHYRRLCKYTQTPAVCEHPNSRTGVQFGLVVPPPWFGGAARPSVG
jgi:transposase